LLIVAGAGTGKTTVITEKIAYLINNKLAKPEEILALTFTDKAADEMLSRVDNLLNLGYVDMQISTFHAFCQRLLETYGLEIGLPNQFKLVTETDAWLMIEQKIYNFGLNYYRPLGNPTRHIYELLRHFSKCKDELITPAEYLEYAEGISLDHDKSASMEKSRLLEIANAYHAYNQMLLDKNALDFGDLIFYTIKLLKDRPHLLKKIQANYKYILVDEFQDVNWAQYQLVRLIADSSEPIAQLTVVGDDDQSIYAFRGASVSNILRFKEDFPNAKEIVLTENYRSGQKILDTAYTSIQNNNPDRLEVKLKIDKRLKASNNQLSKVNHLHSTTLDEEVRSVLKEITELKKNDPDMRWDDIAILVRANGHAEPFIHALELAHIPYEFLASSGLYRQPIVLDCINFFTTITDHYNSVATYRLLRLPSLSFSENDIQKLVYQAGKKSVTYYEAVKRASEFQLSKDGVDLSNKLITIIHNGMKTAKSEKPTVVLYKFLEESGYLSYLAKQEEQGNRTVIRQIYQLKQFFDFIKRYEETIPGADVRQLVDHLTHLIDSGSEGKLYMPTDTPDSVNIMTIHAAKGLEFRHVFVVNLVEERFPTRRRGEGIEVPETLIKEHLPEGDYHIEEERRLFYVAVTRAKERLYLTSADDYGGTRKKKISRFLTELDISLKHSSTQALKHDNSGVIRQWNDFNTLKNTDELEVSNLKFDLPKAFSFSQVKSYETCPYQYKLAHILKIPTRGSASFSFGQTIHATMQKFYDQVKVLNSASQTSLFDTRPTEPALPDGAVKVPTRDELFEMYESSWQGDWYSSAKQRDEYYKKGKEILTMFYAAEDGRWTIPVALESWFKIKVGDYFLHGRIDRVDQLSDRSLEIIDYKTGKSKEKVVGEEKDQLLIYQIAAETLPEYRNIGTTSKLTFFYVNDNIKTSFIGDSEDLQALKEKLLKTITAIHSGDFFATPSQFACGFCDFRDICEYRAV
ncbi:MAG: ATP-dependent helicase, partial [Candidatus Magasanikbacteria bacterium]|nr:ATP-dependent helicase [Candidatus Magasanikbacteria bacterium]